MINPELLESYLKTTYEIYSEEKTIKIRIGEFNPDIDKLLEKYRGKSWAFITAYNPYSKKLTEKENKIRHDKLLNELRDYKTLPGAGKPDNNKWEPEISVLVIDISEQIIDYFAGKYQQKAVVKGKIGQNPKLKIY